MTDPIDIHDALDQMSEEALECRDFQHSWQSYRAWREDWGFERILRCRNCLTERHETLDRSGSVVRRHYVYADGYTIKGLGRLTGSRRDAVRLASILRSIPEKPAVKEAS